MSMLAGAVHMQPAAPLRGARHMCNSRIAGHFRTQRPQRMRQPCRASLSEDMEQIQREIHNKEALMQRHADQEDYKAAAAERDSIQLLQMRRRHLELELEKEEHENVEYSIGTVIRHRKYDYKGVIVGYDTSCTAPDSWTQVMGVDSLPQGRRQPFYHVLVDERDRPNGNATYVAQENINPMPPSAATPVLNDLVEHNFEPFAGGRYKPKKHIVEQYPHARHDGGDDADSSEAVG